MSQRSLVGVVMLCAVMSFSVFGQGQQDVPANSRKVTNRVAPSYPELARSMNVKGIVRLEALVAPNGQVKTVAAKGGHPLLVQAAENALHKWRWERAGTESKEEIEIRFDPH